MTVMNSELYRALREAQVSEESASKAAESVAAYDAKFAEVRQDIAAVRGDLRLVKWMMGFCLTGLAGVLWALVTLSAQVGRLTEAVSRITS